MSELNAIAEQVYAELRALAQHYLGFERGSLPVDATSLVHEAYLRLANRDPEHWKDQRHFFAVAARAIRRILIDHARRRQVAARDAEQRAADTLTCVNGPDGHPAGLLDLDAALSELSELSERQAQIVELRYFGGLSIDEVAECIGCAPRTVDADWRMAKRWLKQRLAAGAQP